MIVASLYRFSGIYNNFKRSNFGLIIYNTKNVPSTATYLNDILCRKMGYDNDTEYMNTYPGKFTNDSRLKDIYIGGDWKYKQSLNNNIDTIMAGYFDTLKECIDHLSISRMPTYCTALFIVPTTDEVFDDGDNVDNIKHEDLWFCSDWNENCSLGGGDN